MQAWSENEPVVELHADGRLIDLHNWASFLGFEYDHPEEFLIRFEFDESEGGRREGPPRTEIRLRFRGLSDLRVYQEELEHSYEPETLDHFLYRTSKPGRGWVQVSMMDGLTITFEAGSVGMER